LSALPAVLHTLDKGDYVPVGGFPFALRPAVPGDLDEVHGLVREAAKWLRTSKDTDQWASPWPDRAGKLERTLNDLLKGKTWLVWDGMIVVATITVDTEEPLDENEQSIWPAHRLRESALYVRRVIVSRSYAGLGLGAALLMPASLGLLVRKSGRSTGLTTGSVIVVDATVSVDYEAGQSAHFDNQILTSPMSKPGDSGSLLVAANTQQAVGLLFAGSDQTTIYNPIQAVLDSLEVTL